MTIKKRIREVKRIGWFVSAAFFAMSAMALFVETQLPRILLAAMIFVGTGIGVVMAAGMFCPFCGAR
jgi:hypothetical protein